MLKMDKSFPLHYRIYWTLRWLWYQVFPRKGKKKLMIVGYGRHGKDTVCEYLETMGYKYAASSWFLAELLFLILKDEMGYTSVQECFDDRANHRARWHKEISAYNTPNKTTLGRMIYEKNDIYCGIRCQHEFNALKRQGVFDYSVWVDALKRKPPEASDSMSVRQHHADLVLDNNGDFLRTTIPALKAIIDHIEGN